MAWPTIQLPAEVHEDFERAQHMDEFETGRMATRARQTSARPRFRLVWPAMTSADLSALKAAHNTDAGAAFDWEHPETGVVHSVIYYSGVKTTYRPSGYHQVEVSIGER